MKGADPAVVKELIERMRKIEGQARGIQKMMEEGRECDEILNQLAAMRAAINKVGMRAIGCHLESSLEEELARGQDGHQSIEKVIETFLRFS